jgi:hypothetical protein
MAPPLQTASATGSSYQPGFMRDPRLNSYTSQSSLAALPPQRLEDEVVHWADRAMRQAEEESSQSLTTKLLPRIMQYLAGNQWPSRPTAYGSSRPVTNRMFRQYWELVSLLTDGKPEPEIKVWDRQDTYSEIQDYLGKRLAHWAATSSYRPELQSIIGFGLLAKGIGKVQWNRQANRGVGDVEILSINPLNFYTLGGDGTIANAECVIETKRVTLASLRRRFGTLADDIEPDSISPMMNSQVMRPSQVTSAEWAKFSPQMQKILGVKSSSATSDSLYPMVTQRLFWLLDPGKNETSRTVCVGPATDRGRPSANWAYMVEPGELLFPRGRVLTVAGRRVLNDTCNPYFFARHPYVEMTPLRAPWSPEGMSLLGNLIGPQDILNRIMAGLLETIKAGLTPTIITPRNAVSRSDLDNISTTISGGKLEYNPVSPAPPSFRAQPQVPALALPFLQMVTREMDQTTGSAAIDAAAQKEQIPSHDTMEMIQNSRSSMVRLMGRQLEQFMSEAGQMVVSTILQFDTVGHRVGLLGERGILSTDFQPMYESLLSGSMMPEEFVKKFQFSIKPGSALTFGQEDRAQMALVLRRQGDLSSNNMFRALDANFDLAQNRAELVDEAVLKLKLAAAGAQAANAGKPQGK